MTTTLLAELKDQTRDYWIVPVSPDGVDLKIMHVRKGENSEEIEIYCEIKEHEMIAILETPGAAD
jgi:hypothetical protein